MSSGFLARWSAIFTRPIPCGAICVATYPTSTDKAPARLAIAPIERARFLWWKVLAQRLTCTVRTLTLVPPTSIVLTLTVLTVCSSCSRAAEFLLTTCRAPGPRIPRLAHRGTPRELGGSPWSLLRRNRRRLRQRERHEIAPAEDG